MEVVDDEGIKDLVREELLKLGIQISPVVEAKKTGYGSKFLNKTVQGGINKTVKNKKKNFVDDSQSPSYSKKSEGKKNGSKSPFASSKNRSSTKKKNHQQVQQAKVFGVPLLESCSTAAALPDGVCVMVPKFLVDACNLLRGNLSLEGLFRKAGSTGRQNEVKRLLESGKGLPSDVHVIDAACLLKQYFRCLPQPLIDSSVHSNMIRCHFRYTDVDDKISALMLCTMLMPTHNQHTLIYLLSFLQEVIEHSNNNLMTAHNLALVLSPNLLPMTMPNNSKFQSSQAVAGKKSKLQQNSAGLSLTDDSLISINIVLMEELILHQHRVCRLPSDTIAALIADRNVFTATPQKTQAADTVDAAAVAQQQQPIVSKNKKRRSASIHRLVSGLRRVVGAPALSLAPTSHHPNPNSPHPHQQHRVTHMSSPLQYKLHCSPLIYSPAIAARGTQHPSTPIKNNLHPLTPARNARPTRTDTPIRHGVLIHPSTPIRAGMGQVLSLHPMGDVDDSPKLTSMSPTKRKSDVLMPGTKGVEMPSKRARMSVAEDSSSGPLSYAAAAAATPKQLGNVDAGSKSKVRRSQTARESSSKQPRLIASAAFPRHPSLAAFLDQAPLRIIKKKSPPRRLNPSLSGKLAGLGDMWTNKADKLFQQQTATSKTDNKKCNQVQRPNQSVTVKPIVSDNSTEANKSVFADFVSKKDGAAALISVVKETKKAEKLRNCLDVIESRPLHKSQSEVLPKLNSAIESPTQRTPLSGSKTQSNLKSCGGVSTPNIAGLSTHTTVNSPALTPRNGAGRNSKRARRKARNARLAMLSTEPDGEESDGCLTPSTVSRGVPDGAECTLRNSSAPPPHARNADALENLEDQYLTIKSAVANMELDIESDSLKDMKKSSLFGKDIASIVSLNHNDIIQSAYDRMKKESSVLGISPSENLSRRLDRELKIRRRKSGEGRVMRSPSERKIGTIRRRSRELELKQVKSSLNFDEPNCSTKMMTTPKIKDSLVRSPVLSSLKRGRPNSVRCGLPVLVRSASPIIQTTQCKHALQTPLLLETSSFTPREKTSIKRRSEGSSFSNKSLQNAESKISVSSDTGSENISGSYKTASSLETSPGNMDDHFMPYLKPGGSVEGLAAFSSTVDLDNEHWVTATDFFDQVDDEQILDFTDGGDIVKREKDGNRPSIAALKKQKKVTANVQLFNQLGTSGHHTPGQRRQSRLCATPAVDRTSGQQRPTAASERRVQQRLSAQQRSRVAYRASLTPRHVARSSALHASTAAGTHRPRPKIAVVSPLRENWVNMSAVQTPIRPSAGAPKDDGVFKTPGRPPITPAHAYQNKPRKISSLATEMSQTPRSKEVFL